MEDLIKNKTSKGFFKYPDVRFEAFTGKCEITGESFMEDSNEFYDEIFDWMKKFNNINGDRAITLDIKLEYFNTSSSKMFFELLRLLQEFNKGGQDVKVNWYFHSDDAEIYQDVMDLCYDVNIEINLIPI